MQPTPVTAVGSSAEQLVFHLLLQVIVILVATRAVVWAARRLLGQTDVAGEILAGIVLGPSLLGAVAPDLMHRIFDPSTAPIFSGIAQVGLILLMFQIGLEFELGTLGKARWRVFVISATGLVLPFLLGFVAAPFFWSKMAAPQPPAFGFRLFFALAMSITAIPILGRIFIELGLSHTRTAALVIGAAAIDDVVGWLLLGVLAAIVGSHFDGVALGLRLLGLLAYGLVLRYAARPIALRLLRRHWKEQEDLGPSRIAWVILVLFSAALVTSRLGVFAIIGGFSVGVAIHDQRDFVRAWRREVSPLVTTFFLPIFFAYTGLRTDIGTLGTTEARLECVLVCAIAFAGKFGGCYVASRAVGEGHRSAMTIGVCMNTRALMELIALNIGYELGVVPRQMFTMLVIMAVASTYIATPLIRRLMVGQDRAPDAGGTALELPAA
jgi:Kef-type K+ transport system membrane component KefB